MNTPISKVCLYSAGWLVAVCFTLSLFMCGDTDCLTGNSDENCASLLCSLLSKHETSTQNAASSAGQDCSCVCHMPTVLGYTFDFSYYPVTQYNAALTELQISSAPPRLVYRPPATV